MNFYCLTFSNTPKQKQCPPEIVSKSISPKTRRFVNYSFKKGIQFPAIRLKLWYFKTSLSGWQYIPPAFQEGIELKNLDKIGI